MFLDLLSGKALPGRPYVFVIMQIQEQINPNMPGFVVNAGEMGDLISSYDWSQSPIGMPEVWPPILKTTLGIMLNSAFPMFLFWGREHICFYNDAFRPSLGEEGKHPGIGKPGQEVWDDIWDFIGPLVDQVMTTGKAVGFKDQLVPFYRNGAVEDIYWTFSYSPVFVNDGSVEGVFVTCIETTDSIKTSRKAVDTQHQILSFIESAPFPIGVYMGEEMQIAFANKAIIDVWGKGRDIIGKLYREVLPELEDQYIFQQLAGVYNTGVPFHAKNQRVDLVVDGKPTIYYFNYSFTPLYDSNGKVYGVMNTAADVTDLNLANQRFEQSERNFRSIILQAPVAMCLLLGPDHVIEIANSMMIKLWGKQEEKVMKKPVFEALPDAREQGLEELLDHVYKTGEAVTAYERPVTLIRNGKEDTVYQNFVYEPYRNTDGEIAGVLAISLDVSAQVLARKEVETLVQKRTAELHESNKELKESEERYHRMVEEVEDYAIILLDKEGIIQNWNRGAEKIKGYTESEIIGKSFSVFYPQEDQADGLPNRMLETARESGKATSEGWRVKKNGERFWASIVITALHNEQGDVIGFSKVTRDLTERKIAEDKLKKYSENLEQQNRELEHFAYAASHDMKEPLRKIHFYGAFLQDSIADQLDKKSANYLERIMVSSQKMSHLIDNILTYSKTTADAQMLKPVDLNGIVGEVIGSIEDEHQPNDISITSDQLPVVNGIAFQFSQLFDNLIHNSIKYRRDDEPCVINVNYKLVNRSTDDTVPHPSKKYHRISVVDNGKGFDQLYARKIFEIFQRLDNTHGKSGAGIGLAICRRIVENHNGYITATAEVNKGARFDIYLPFTEG